MIMKPIQFLLAKYEINKIEFITQLVTFNITKKNIKLMITIDQFDINSFTLSDPDTDSDIYPHSIVSVLSYFNKGPNCELILRMPEIIMTQNYYEPISKYSFKFNEESFLRFPFDPKQQNCNKIKTVFSDIDGLMEKNNKHLFGRFSRYNFEYNPIIQKYDHHIDDEKTGFDFWKAKLDIDKDKELIKTQIYVDGPLIKKENMISYGVIIGHKSYRYVPISSISDLNEYLTKDSIVSCDIKGMMFANKVGKEKEYKIRFKIVKMYISNITNERFDATFYNEHNIEDENIDIEIEI